jgi:hypothetical protein
MEKEMINFRINSSLTGKGSLDPESFVVSWQNATDIREVYDSIEAAWQEYGPTAVRKSFYTSRKVGLRQLRARATKYRNKGVPLKTLRGEMTCRASTGKVDWGHLTALAKDELKSASRTSLR